MKIKITMIAAVAWLVLGFAGSALAATEALCTTLGTNCICGEPLNTATHDGGSANWSSPVQHFDPDDSPFATQCYPGKPAENFCASPVFGPIPASQEAAFLPPGHTLSFVFQHVGPSICHIAHPSISEPSPNFTYCLRHYRRWTSTSEWPTHNDPVDRQQKVTTIGWFYPTIFDANNIQISMGGASIPVTDPRGRLNTRFDGNGFDAPNDFQQIGDAETQCVNNYCRFEVCMDVSSAGEGRARLRVTQVAPGSGQLTVHKPVGAVLRPEGVPDNGFGSGPGGLSMFASDLAPNDRATHYIVTRVRPENRLFWPGPASEVEGGGGPTPPAAPAGLTVR